MDPDPDPGGTKTFGYDESGFATQENILILSFIHTFFKNKSLFFSFLPFSLQ